MTNAVTDTHSLIWYLEDDPRLSPAARNAFDTCDRGESTIYVPTIWFAMKPFDALCRGLWYTRSGRGQSHERGI